jgi:thioredoxin-like negative regulator of GroEL
MARLVIYKSDACEPCRQMVPVIKRNARARGDKVKIIDIDSCKSKECAEVSFTPTILRDGKELSETELKRYMTK